MTATETKQILPPFWNENHLEYCFAAKISFFNFSIKIWKTVTKSWAVDYKWFTENCSYLKFLQMQKTPSLKSLWQSTVGRNILKLVVIWDDFFILMIWNFRISRNNSIVWILVVKWCFLSRDLPMYPVFQWLEHGKYGTFVMIGKYLTPPALMAEFWSHFCTLQQPISHFIAASRTQFWDFRKIVDTGL